MILVPFKHASATKARGEAPLFVAAKPETAQLLVVMLIMPRPQAEAPRAQPRFFEETKQSPTLAPAHRKLATQMPPVPSIPPDVDGQPDTTPELGNPFV